MSKMKSARSAPQHSPAILAKAAKIEQRLRDHHAFGLQANSQDRHSTKEYAEEHGLNENTLRKIRAFARQYDAEQLEALCTGRRPNGLPLHWGYIAVLLSVPGKSEAQVVANRSRVQKMAIKQGLSVIELKQVLQRKFPRKNVNLAHGRPIQQPRSVEEGVTRIKAELEVLVRRCQVVADMAKDEIVRKRMRKAAKELLKVANSLP